MNILSIKVLLTNAMDNVVIYTDMPCQMSKEVLPSQEPLALLFYAPADGGADYVRKNFEVEPEIANLRV